MVYWDFYLTIGIFALGVLILLVLLLARRSHRIRAARQEVREVRKYLTNLHAKPVEKGLDPWAKEPPISTRNVASEYVKDDRAKYDWQKEAI